METTSLERNRRERRDKLHKHPALLIIQQGNSMLKVRMKARRDHTQLISYLQTVAEVVLESLDQRGAQGNNSIAFFVTTALH